MTLQSASQSQMLPLEAVADIRAGLPTYRLRAEASTPVPVLKVRDLNHAHEPGWKLDTVEVSQPDRLKPYRVQARDIVVTARGTNLKVALVPERWAGALLDWNLIAIHPGPRLRAELIFGFLQSPAGRRAVDRRLTGTTLLMLTVGNLKEIEVPVPPVEQQQILVRLLQAADRQYESAIAAAELRRRIAQKVAWDAMKGARDEGESA